mgnify:CR=1 FL=1
MFLNFFKTTIISYSSKNNASRLAFGAYDGVQALVCPASKVKAKFLNILKPFGIYTWLRKSVSFESFLLG